MFFQVEVQEAPPGSKSPKIEDEIAEVDLEAGVGPSTSGVGSPNGPGPLGLSLPPSAQPTSQPTSAPVSATPADKTQAAGTPSAKTPASGKPPSKTPGSGTLAGKTPSGATPAEGTGSSAKTTSKSKSPASKGAVSKTPRSNVPSKQGTPSLQSSPTKHSSRQQSRAEAAEEMGARSSQQSAVLVTPAKSSKSRTSGKVAERAADEDRGSDRSISPSQRFTPNRGLTEAEIF